MNRNPFGIRPFYPRKKQMETVLQVILLQELGRYPVVGSAPLRFRFPSLYARAFG